MLTEANPFEELSPVMRNEEDEIRKGVFSYALRKLQGLSLPEKRAWCEVIKVATAPKQPKEKAATASPSAMDSAATGHRRASTQEQDSAACTAKRERSVSLEHPLSEPPSKEAKQEGGVATATAAAAAACDASKTSEEASEFISAYMRTLLEKVVGGSLSDLAVPALRVLCQMVGVETSARSKDALYSILANFHFTKCAKLGKRVSRQVFIEKEARQTAEMMSKVSSIAKAGARKQPPQPPQNPTERERTTAKTTAAAAKAEKKGLRRREGRQTEGEESQAKRPTAARTTAAAPPPPPPNASPNASHTKALYTDGDIAYADSSDDDDNNSEGEGTLDVAYHQRVFQPPPRPATSSASSSIAAVSAEGGWTNKEFERTVASIVHVYDLVTVKIIVDKLAQMGYRAPNAADAVENTLRRFHALNYVIYENGFVFEL